MTEQADNELIAEKLLGWKRADGGWIKQDSFMYGGCGTPTFTTWVERGLIIDALQKAWPLSKEALRDIGGTILMGALTDQDVRAAALAYLRAQP
jgi:hypothetical protein